MAGRPPDVTDAEVLAVLHETDDSVLFTGEVADESSIRRDGVRQRLYDLYEQEFVNKKQRGNVLVWWLSGEGEQYLDGEQDASTLEDRGE